MGTRVEHPLRYHFYYIKVTQLSAKLTKLLMTENDSFADIKAQIQDKEGIPTDDQRLILNTHEVKDTMTLKLFLEKEIDLTLVVSTKRQRSE